MLGVYNKKMVKRKRTSSKKRSFKRRRTFRSRRSRGSISAKKAPMPNKYACKMRYCGEATINPGVAGIAGVHVINANGLWDPDTTGTGHQPRGFDQLMSMYDHYVVVGAKLKVTFCHDYGSSYNALCCGINLLDTNSVFQDRNDYLEGRHGVNTTFSAFQAGTGAGEAGMRRLSMKSSTKKFLGRSNVMSDPELKGGVTSNPTEGLFFHVWAAPFTGSGDEAALPIRWTIEYLCILIEPKQPGQS